MSLQEFNHLTDTLEKIADLQAELQEKESDLLQLKQTEKSLKAKIRKAKKKLENHESGRVVTKAFTKSETELNKLARFFDEPDIGLASRSMSHWKSKVKEVYPDPSKSSQHTTKTVLTAEQASKKYTIAFMVLLLAATSIMFIETTRFSCETGNETVSYYTTNDGDKDCADGSDEQAEIDLAKEIQSGVGFILVCFWFPGLLIFLLGLGDLLVEPFLDDDKKKEDTSKTSERDTALKLLNDYVSARSSFNDIKKSIPAKVEAQQNEIRKLESSLAKLESSIADNEQRIDTVKITVQNCIDSIEHLVPSTN